MTDEKETTKEQILGLYVVGLLAVLVAVRVSTELDPVSDMFFMVVIMFWGAYSFIMVFAYANIARLFESPLYKSTYEQFANFLKDVAQIFLLFSLGASIIFFILYFWALLLIILLVLVVILPIYYLGRALKKRLKKKNRPM